MEAMCDTVDALLHDEPPLPEEKLEIVPFRLSNGPITRPLDCTNGWPPRPLSLPSVTPAKENADTQTCRVGR